MNSGILKRKFLPLSLVRSLVLHGADTWLSQRILAGISPIRCKKLKFFSFIFKTMVLYMISLLFSTPFICVFFMLTRDFTHMG